MTTRRQFIKESGSVVLGASALGHLGTQLAHAEPTEEGGRGRPTLVAIYLRGGADSLNTLVPHGDPLYYRNRPSIAIPRPGAQGSGGALRLNDLFGRLEMAELVLMEKEEQAKLPRHFPIFPWMKKPGRKQPQLY